jgi:hypothetical protein
VSFVSRQERRLIDDAQQTVDSGIRNSVTASGDADDDARLTVRIQQDPGEAARLHDLAEPTAQHQLEARAVPSPPRPITGVTARYARQVPVR